MYKRITLLFLGWRLILFFISVLAVNILPLAYIDRFLGGGPINYPKIPLLFAWANFDGEHYLSIAIFGYKGLEQAFFPVYPMLMKLLAMPFISNLYSSLVISTSTGLIVSNLSLLGSLYLMYKLLRLDYDKSVVFESLVWLLIFPTAFYFGAVYSESTYLFISLLCFYMARQKRWFWAGFFGMIASATRIFGIILLLALILETYQSKAKIRESFWMLMIPLGLLGYMSYQYLSVGDPLAFYHLQKIVGEQHQSGLTLLPQVYFRYIKILLTVNPYDPIYQTMILEAFTGVLFFVLPIIGYFKKVRWSYLSYSMLGFLTPTIQGSLSSVPRYVLVFFPAFLILALYFKNKKILKYIVMLVSFVWMLIETALFLRGYWVA